MLVSKNRKPLRQLVLQLIAVFYWAGCYFIGPILIRQGYFTTLYKHTTASIHRCCVCAGFCIIIIIIIIIIFTIFQFKYLIKSRIRVRSRAAVTG